MPLDWTAYDAFPWADSQQVALAPAERAALADLVAEVLGLSATVQQTVWGAAAPPGRFAATVVRVGVDLLPLTWRERAGPLNAVGVKVFKTTGDAVRAAAKLLPFHATQLAHLPGLPHPRVQRSLAGGRTRGRAWLLLEWLEGLGLDVWRSRFTKTNPAPLPVVVGLLDQLLAEIVVPLWSAGLIWWDFRDANCCVDGTNRLTLLDVDSLAAYADEILAGTTWTQRDKGRLTAEGRLRNMAWRLLQCAGRSGKRTEVPFRAAWEQHVAPVLAGLGKTVSRGAGQAGVRAFLTAVTVS